MVLLIYLLCSRYNKTITTSTIATNITITRTTVVDKVRKLRIINTVTIYISTIVVTGILQFQLIKLEIEKVQPVI